MLKRIPLGLSLVVGSVIICAVILGFKLLRYTEGSFTIEEGYVFPYDLTDPDEKFKLSSKLEEISGLTMYSHKKLLCVQDEDAWIFEFDIEDDEVDEKIDFGKDGDYEGITMVDETVYVLRMDGDLYKVTDYDKKDQETEKIETTLSDKNNTEGLCYDPVENRLLIAAKDRAGDGKKWKNKRSIFEYDLEKEELKNKPAYVIDLEELAELMNSSKSKEKFKPSGIAIHPSTGHIYIIGSVGKKLLVLDRKGNIIYIETLDPSIFKQPEGITFSDDADLFISTEGAGGKAKIYKFSPRSLD